MNGTQEPFLQSNSPTTVAKAQQLVTRAFVEVVTSEMAEGLSVALALVSLMAKFTPSRKGRTCQIRPISPIACDIVSGFVLVQSRGPKRRRG